MKVLVLTSSRADYGIYHPLLKKMKADPFFELDIAAFGTHLSPVHGYTLKQILADGFGVKYRIRTHPAGDTPGHIALSMAGTMKSFTSLWKKIAGNIDLVFCLGDRYEMFSAVAASVPFNIPVAHVHGGETTLGSVDNVFRHSLSLMASMHFTATKEYARKVALLRGSGKNIFSVGALGLDNIGLMKLLSDREFEKEYGIDSRSPFILVTFHPETVSPEKNKKHVQELLAALNILKRKYRLVITMPNADTSSNTIRNALIRFGKANKKDNVLLVENFGTKGYFSCMNLCSFVLGNSSSGIIEAASFGKYVIDAGDRQKGRLAGKNVIHVPVACRQILDAVTRIEKLPSFRGRNIYGDGLASEKITQVIKRTFNG